MPLLGG